MIAYSSWLANGNYIIAAAVTYHNNAHPLALRCTDVMLIEGLNIVILAPSNFCFYLLSRNSWKHPDALGGQRLMEHWQGTALAQGSVGTCLSRDSVLDASQSHNRCVLIISHMHFRHIQMLYYIPCTCLNSLHSDWDILMTCSAIFLIHPLYVKRINSLLFFIKRLLYWMINCIHNCNSIHYLWSIQLYKVFTIPVYSWTEHIGDISTPSIILSVGI